MTRAKCSVANLMSRLYPPVRYAWLATIMRRAAPFMHVASVGSINVATDGALDLVRELFVISTLDPAMAHTALALSIDDTNLYR
jgi:hypothetical protein